MGIFSNLRVLDLGRVLAAPYCSQILGDLGAEIIKVEHPEKGDETRHWGPPYVDDNEQTGLSAYFTCANRNKKSLAVNIATPQGQYIIRRLARISDVVIENFKSGGLKKYQLDYPSLKAENKRLIYCSITGFGQSGQQAKRPGYDLMIQAISGLMSITGEAGRAPVKVGVAVCDITAGLYATIAILSALWERQTSNEGQHIDMSLFNVSLNMLANQAANYLIGDTIPQAMGSQHPNIVPYQAFATADDYILICVGNDSQFAALCEILHLPDLARNPDTATNQARIRNRNSLIPMLQERLQQKPQAFWQDSLTQAGIPCAPINNIAQAFAETSANEQNMRRQQQHPQLGTITTTANPIKFSRSSNVGADLAPPLLGEHTRQILQQHLKLSPQEIQTLKANGIIKSP